MDTEVLQTDHEYLFLVMCYFIDDINTSIYTLGIYTTFKEAVDVQKLYCNYNVNMNHESDEKKGIFHGKFIHRNVIKSTITYQKKIKRGTHFAEF